MTLRIVVALLLYLASHPIKAQPPRMTDEQQAWFNCLIAKSWCVSRSTDKTTQDGKLVAMISANGPAYYHGRVTRMTLQVACSDGKPVTMLMSGREIGPGDLALEYQVSPSGKMAKLVAKQVSAGYFFEIQDPTFLADLRAATKLGVQLSFPTDSKPSLVEYNLGDTDAALKRLGCF